MRKPMAKKLKTYILLALCVTLTSCDESCTREERAFWDYLTGYIFVATSNGAYHYGPTTALITGSQGDLYSQFVELPQYVNPALHPMLPSYYQPGLIGIRQMGITRWNTTSQTPNRYDLSSTPLNAIYDPRQYVLYTSHPSEGEIQKFDLHTNSVAMYFPLGPQYQPGLMASPADCSYIGVLDIKNLEVLMFSPMTDTVTHTIPLTGTPSFLGFVPDGKQLWTGDTLKSVISTWEPMTGTKIRSITSIPSPNALLFTRDGSDSYITSNASPYSLYFVSTETYKIDNMLTLNEKPVGLTQDPHGTNVWIQNISGTITVVDPLHYSIIGTTAQVPGTPLSIFSLSTALKF